MAEVREPEPALALRLRLALEAEGVEVVRSGRALGARTVVVWWLPTAAGMEPLGRAHPRARVLVLVDDPTGPTIASFLGAGAKAVADRRGDPAGIAAAAVAVARGYLVLPSDGRRALLPAQVAWRLTDEHLAWMRALHGGLDVAALAQQVGCSERVMYRRLREVYDLLRVPGRLEAVRLLARASLLDEPAVGR